MPLVKKVKVLGMDSIAEEFNAVGIETIGG
jgi:ribonucleotide monophosphatase NagD (HAD superfamily)